MGSLAMQILFWNSTRRPTEPCLLLYLSRAISISIKGLLLFFLQPFCPTNSLLPKLSWVFCPLSKPKPIAAMPCSLGPPTYLRSSLKDLHIEANFFEFIGGSAARRPCTSHCASFRHAFLSYSRHQLKSILQSPRARGRL